MNIIVKTSKGETYTVEVSGEEEKIETVKSELLRKMNSTNKKIKLIHSGKLLQDENTLASYSLKDGAVIHLLVPGVEKKSPPPSEEQKKQATGQSAQNPAPNSSSSSHQPNQSLSDLGNFLSGTSQGHEMPRNSSGRGQSQNPFSFPGGSEDYVGMMDKEMLKELMRNPEQMNMLLDNFFAINKTPEEYKAVIKESFRKMSEIEKNNPEQLDQMINMLMANNGMMMNNPQMNPFFNAGQQNRQGQFPTQASSGADDAGHEYPYNNAFMTPKDFNKEAALSKYSKELEQLKEIGYSDERLNLLALFFTDGDLTKAVNLILDWRNERQA